MKKANIPSNEKSNNAHSVLGGALKKALDGFCVVLAFFKRIGSGIASWFKLHFKDDVAFLRRIFEKLHDADNVFIKEFKRTKEGIKRGFKGFFSFLSNESGTR